MPGAQKSELCGMGERFGTGLEVRNNLFKRIGARIDSL